MKIFRLFVVSAVSVTLLLASVGQARARPSGGSTVAPTHCCDAAEEPGAAGNQDCATGYLCCADGTWKCNDATGAATCSVCDDPCCNAVCCSPLEEPGQLGNPPCIEGATCCSDGTWQCNGASGESTCALDGVVCDPGCCDPAQRPNSPGNEFCASGFVCCDDGIWQCNDATGAATCAPGVECTEICGGITGIACEAANEFCKLPTGECCCDAFGVCTEIPEVCPEFLDPVCGCDGVTYDNECFADMAGVSVDHPGPCLQVCGGIAGIPCGEGEFCLLPEGRCCCDFEGVCVPIPQQCHGDCDPVCGCDGRTFENACMAVMNEVSIDHAGPCFEGGALITGVRFESKTKMSWEPQDTALFYNVYRNGVCFKTEVFETSVPVEGAPQAGVPWLFQVAGQYPDGEGPLGINWLCEPRVPALSCSPSEQTLCEATGGAWDPLSCGHYPCGQFPSCDAIIPGCDCGPGNNYSPTVGCLPDPTCP